MFKSAVKPLLCLILILALAAPCGALAAEDEAPAADEAAPPVADEAPQDAAPAEPDGRLEALQAALDEANARAEALQAELDAAKGEIGRLETQRDLLLDEIRAFAIDLAVARGEDAEPTFESDAMRLTLVMPTYTRLIPYNGALHIVSADQKAQGLLSVIVDGEGRAYTRGGLDHNQVFAALIADWFPAGDTPETTPTESPEGLRLTRAVDGTTRDEVWLIAGETQLYCLEALGEGASIDALFDQIAEGLTTR